MFGFLGSQTMEFAGRSDVVVWYQDSALVYVPIVIAVAIWAYIGLKSVPVKANIKQQFDIFKNQDTWWMTILYRSEERRVGKERSFQWQGERATKITNDVACTYTLIS